MKRKIILGKNIGFQLIFWATLVFLSFFSFTAAAQTDNLPGIFDERPVGEGYFTMKDLQSGETIMKTARLLHLDDQYINHDNKLYQVEKIDGDLAWARFREKIDLADFPLEEVLKGFSQTNIDLQAQPQKRQTLIGIYHSHGAEAYVPSDGSESIPQGGGIIEVGRAFARALKEKGFKTIHSSETHVPHDAGAYYRSRRTAEELLREGPTVLFDVHRDAVPPEEYSEVVDNEQTVQIQFVVGRQNQNLQTNREFAESLKRAADETHPGLIKGIFLARGNYNQDMMPLSLLLEVGAHENNREEAEKAMALFSDAVGLYFLGREGIQAREGIGMTALRTVLWVVLLAGVVLGVYLLIGTGNIDELRAKLTHFFRKEFAEFRGKRGRENGGGE